MAILVHPRGILHLGVDGVYVGNLPAPCDPTGGATDWHTDRPWLCPVDDDVRLCRKMIHIFLDQGEYRLEFACKTEDCHRWVLVNGRQILQHQATALGEYARIELSANGIDPIVLLFLNGWHGLAHDPAHPLAEPDEKSRLEDDLTFVFRGRRNPAYPLPSWMVVAELLLAGGGAHWRPMGGALPAVPAEPRAVWAMFADAVGDGAGLGPPSGQVWLKFCSSLAREMLVPAIPSIPVQVAWDAVAPGLPRTGVRYDTRRLDLIARRLVALRGALAPLLAAFNPPGDVAQLPLVASAFDNWEQRFAAADAVFIGIGANQARRVSLLRALLNPCDALDYCRLCREANQPGVLAAAPGAPVASAAGFDAWLVALGTDALEELARNLIEANLIGNLCFLRAE